MDIFKLLREDHARIKQGLEALCNTTERAVKKRTRLFEVLKREFRLHAALEEQLLYPILGKGSKADRFQALEAEEEHRAALTLMAEIERTPPDDERWLPRLMVLKENIEHHITEEEKGFFKRVRALTDRQDAKMLGEEAETYKQEHLPTA